MIRYHCAKHPPGNPVTGEEKRLLLLSGVGWQPSRAARSWLPAVSNGVGNPSPSPGPPRLCRDRTARAQQRGRHL